MSALRARLACGLALACTLALGACAEGGTLQPCNITQRACQEDIYYAVLRLRGDGWDPFAGLPPIRTISVEQYRAELERGRDEATPVPAPAPDAKPKADPWSTALQLLGLVTPATSVAEASVDSQVDNVAAFYAPSVRKVTVIDRGGQRDDVGDTICSHMSSCTRSKIASSGRASARSIQTPTLRAAPSSKARRCCTSD